MEYVMMIAFAIGIYAIVRHTNLNWVVTKRRRYIDDFVFPRTISQRLQERYPHLNEAQTNDVVEGLRDYFHICNEAGRKMVSMPSQAVDVVWHEFILFTLQYQNFCKKAFGRFLHHMPAEAMKKPTVAQQGIKLAWKLACQHEHISPRTPHRLPRIFALDALLNIPDGFTYQLNCQRRLSTPGSSCGGYCASHIGCSSSCSSIGGCGSSSGCSSSSDGGGCGGGGD